MGSPDPDFMPVAFQAGVAFHEAYEANVKAGFTPPQALYLVAAQVTGNPGIAPGLDAGEPPSD